MLWSLSCLFKDERVKEKMVRNNGLTKVLLVMQSKGEGNMRQICAELVKVLIKFKSFCLSYSSNTYIEGFEGHMIELYKFEG